VDGQRHIYHPKGSKDDASRSAMRHVVRTFFGGDASRAIVTLLGEARLSREELDEIAAMIDESAEGEA
jgi:predicted transcriptional regulator